jgi:hypothetical protein
MKRLYVTLYPGPVQDDVYENQDSKNYGQIEVDAAPLVTVHRQEILGFGGRPAAAKTLAVTCRARRQNESHNKAGTNQRQQVQKSNKIDYKINRRTFHHAKPKYYTECSRKRAFNLKGRA